MTIKPILEKYITVGDYMYSDYSKDFSKLSKEECNDIFCNAPVVEQITEIQDYDVLSISLNGKEGEPTHSWTYLLDIIFHSIVVDTNGEIFNREGLKAELQALHPNLFKITPDRIAERIQKGYKYLFSPSGVDAFKEVDVAKKHKHTVEAIDMGGVVSKGGFLDLHDTLTKCLFFNEEGKRVDISDLKEDLENRWIETV